MTSHHADPALIDVNNTRRDRCREAERATAMCVQQRKDFAFANLDLGDVLALELDTSSSKFYGMGTFGPAFAGTHRGQACAVLLGTRLDKVLDGDTLTACAKDIAEL